MPDQDILNNRKQLIDRVHSPALAWIVLCTSLVLTLFAWLISRKYVEERATERFQFKVKKISESIVDRMNLYEEVLRAGVAFFDGSDFVTREEWHRFIKTLEIERNWPGIQAIGYTVPVKKEDLQNYIENVRKEVPEFNINPVGERDKYTSIHYIEPFDWRNKRALGFDMWTNEMRRRAMKRAIETGKASASDLIKLVQEIDKDVQKGFVVYLPVYEKDADLSTVEKRREAFKGWVSSPFRTRDLMNGILSKVFKNGNKITSLEIYDGKKTREHLLYASKEPLHIDSPDFKALHSDEITLNIKGRKWQVFVYDQENPLASAMDLPMYIALAGLCIDLFLFYIILYLSSVQKKATEIAKQVVEDLEVRGAELEIARGKAVQSSLYKSAFLANMSHEIRTPMTAILGYVSQIKGNPGITDPEVHEQIEVIEKNSIHLLAILNDILDLSKIEAGKLELDKAPFNLFDLVEDVTNLMQGRIKEKGLEIKVEWIFPIPSIISSDPVRVRQILINLFGNAVKFTEKGSVSLKLSWNELRSEISFEVKDTGIGMSEEQASGIFSEFVQGDNSITRQFGGTGLGLAITDKLCAIIGGRVELETEPEKGSTFTFILKVENTEKFTNTLPELPEKKSHVEKKEFSGTALLIDDNPTNLILISKVLSKMGLTVQSCESGLEAVELLSARPADFDIVFMDVQMPVMDGFTAVRKLKEAGIKVPVVALTANAMKSDREKCIKSGFEEFATKPIDYNALTVILDKFL